MSLDLQVWALAHGIFDDVALPDLGDYSITPQASGVGAVSISYPRDGRNFATLRAMVDEARNVEIEIRVDGTSSSALRALLFTAEGDDIAESAVWTFTGKTLFTLLEDWVLPYNDDFEAGGDSDTGETFIDGNPGLVIGTLLAWAKADGCCLDLTTTTWTTGHDSNGVPWANELAVTLSPGRSLADVISTTLAKVVDAEVTSARELKLYNPGTMGVDRTIPGAEVTLEHGRDLQDAPVRFDLTEARSALVVSGSDGIYTSASDSVAASRLGRKRVGYQSFNSVDDPGSLDAVALLALDGLSFGAAEYSQGLTLEALSRVVPGRDIGLGDWVLRAVNGRTQRLQVVRYTLSRSGREIKAAVTLGDLIQARAVRTAARIDAILGGDVATGTSIRPARVDDGKLPAAPTGLVVTSAAYYDGGTPLAQATATWGAVVTNVDATLADDIVEYVVEFQYQAGQGLSTDWQTAGSTGITFLSWSPLVANVIAHVRVSAVDMFGHRSAPSAITVVSTARDADAPPVLPAPVGEAYLGLLTWAWNGLGADGSVMPADFSEAELHMGPPGFTVHRPLRPDLRLDTAASTTYRDRLAGAGTLPIDPGGDYGVEWGARWVSVDKSGNASTPSTEGRATRTQVADGDVAELSIGKLRAGILTALMTVAGIIRTAASGARVELDTAGFRCIGADGTVLLSFSIPNSLLTMVGKLVAGRGIGTGSTIVVDPGPPPRIRLYPDGTQQSFAITATSTLRPDGTTGAAIDMSAFNAAGQPDGFSLWQFATNAWLGIRDTVGTFNPVIVMQRVGGGMFLQGTTVTATADATAVGQVNLTAAGKSIGLNSVGVDIDAAGGQFFVGTNADNCLLGDATDVQVISAGAVKSFVIDHPTDPDRLLVHGCVEGPEAAVIYRGTVVLDDTNVAVVELPAYFTAATRPGSETVQLTAELATVQTRGKVRPMVMQAAPTRVEDGRFYVVAPGAPAGVRVHWTVMATRADVDELVVEPLRTGVEVLGDGPYRFIVPSQEDAA